MNVLSVRSGLAAAFAATALALAGCGGGGGGDDQTPAPAPAPSGPPVPVPTGTSPITLTANTPATTFAALAPKVTVGRVTIASPPTVDFSITDVDGNAIIGFGSTSKSATATVASYPNLAFSLAKLVPAGNGSPSKWVSYIVTSVPNTTTAAAPTRPTTDNTGTLVDHGNGTYTYTFYRDITKVKDDVAAMTVTGSNNKADLGDLTYDPSLVHRLAIQVSGNAPGTGTNTANGVQVTPGVLMVNPVDVIYDFVPATGQPPSATDASRDIVANAKCEECHRKLGGIPGDSTESSGALFHNGARNNVQYCVVCHTEQRKYGQTEATYNAATMTFSGRTYVVDGRAVGNLPNHIHKTHMGKLLAKKSYDYGGVKYNETLFPQDIRNCTKCHDGSATSTAKTKDGDNWKNAPNRVACGGCHDGINFATGKGVTLADAAAGKTSTIDAFGFAHGAREGLTDDARCSNCHTATTIDLVHTPVTPPSPTHALLTAAQGGSITNTNTNSAWIASNTSRLPPGAIKITYEIKTVGLNASRNPFIVFRILQNGARADFNDKATKTEIYDGFFGSPSVQFVYAVPQDGITAPTDFNGAANGYLRSIWNGTSTGSSTGTISAPDASGFYTVTLTNVTVPTTAKMLTGGLGFSYNVLTAPPLTQANLPAFPVTASQVPLKSAPTVNDGLTLGMPNMYGGLVVIAPNVTMAATSTDARRPIVEDARCNKCHQELGTFTEEAFHGGQRNDGTTCSWCHNPNRTSSGWSADSTSFVHAIHGSGKRTEKFTWHSSSPTESFDDIKYPGILAQCETCHLPGTYELATDTSNKLYRASATGIFNGTAGTVTTGCNVTVINDCKATATSVASISPYVVKDNTTNYGPTSDKNLVISPTATACFACHDSTTARQHMEGNGASIYALRGTSTPAKTDALAKAELCTLCHGPGRVADVKVMHSK